jgi:hypothetical protein
VNVRDRELSVALNDLPSNFNKVVLELGNKPKRHPTKLRFTRSKNRKEERGTGVVQFQKRACL